MKVEMHYEGLKHIAKKIAGHISTNVANPALFSVMRGGMTLAHLVGYELRLPVGAYYPAMHKFIHPSLQEAGSLAQFTFVFLEDVLATGRTLSATREHMESIHQDFRFYPSVIDQEIFDKGLPECVVHAPAFVTADWISFPYEEFDVVVEGDRGLFRDGTSLGSQAERKV
jgi:hypoxanthine phosphoribosyltransferase